MDPSVQRVIEVMKENTSRDLSPADLAEHVQFAPRRFSHLFKAETGTTPARFLKSLRMRQAKDLLENSFLATREIMRRVGLSSESHFARDFKKYYGVTPGQFRLAAHLARRNEEKCEAETTADVTRGGAAKDRCVARLTDGGTVVEADRSMPAGPSDSQSRSKAL